MAVYWCGRVSGDAVSGRRGFVNLTQGDTPLALALLDESVVFKKPKASPCRALNTSTFCLPWP